MDCGTIKYSVPEEYKTPICVDYYFRNKLRRGSTHLPDSETQIDPFPCKYRLTCICMNQGKIRVDLKKCAIQGSLALRYLRLHLHFRRNLQVRTVVKCDSKVGMDCLYIHLTCMQCKI